LVRISLIELPRILTDNLPVEFFESEEFTMSDRLDGTVALVTGASSGIGEAAARALAAQGAAVALAARRKERLDILAAEIQRQGGRALAIETDVTRQEEAAAAVERTAGEFGRLDILINNAGVMLLGPIVEAPLEEWERMVSLNLLGMLYSAHAALPHLLRAAEDSPRRATDLVNISSIAGRVARSGAGVYDLTKFGIGAFSESLRQEVTGRHVRVSLVEPGLVATELGTHLRPEIRAQRQNLNKIESLQAEDIADAIQYIVTRPWRVAVNEIMIRPTEQEW
jgi:NADP-dependent 3-hydroxy acid dehydrogenase YdfG